MKALFEITRRAHRPNYSMKTPVADTPKFYAFQESATALTAELADGTQPIVGFVTQQILITGPILDDSIYPNRLELPVKAGDEASFEYAEEIEAEGGAGSAAQTPAENSFLVTAGGQAIAVGTALKTPLSFTGGQFQVAASGQFTEFMLVAQLTPNLTNNVRIKARRIPGYKVP